jgi:hypothetical protein
VTGTPEKFPISPDISVNVQVNVALPEEVMGQQNMEFLMFTVPAEQVFCTVETTPKLAPLSKSQLKMLKNPGHECANQLPPVVVKLPKPDCMVIEVPEFELEFLINGFELEL